MARFPLSPQWRRALEILADAGETGVPRAVLLGGGFSNEMLDSLVQIGLATSAIARDSKPASLRITALGSYVLGPRTAV